MPEESRSAVPFEKGLEKLEEIVKQLESGEESLEKSLELFEQGMSLSSVCRKQLEDAESRVEILVRKGTSVTPEPFK